MTTHTWNTMKKMMLCSCLTAALLGGTSGYVWGAFSFDQGATKQVTILDGHTRKVVTTHADSFRQLLSELDVSLKSYDKYWASSRDVENGSVLVVERAKPVTIIANGKTKVVYTTQQTVQGVVNEAGFDWKTMMALEDGMMKVKEGMQIHVVPYTMKVVKKKEAMPIQYNYWFDGRLSPGEEVVVEEGTPGTREVEVEEYVSEGKVIRSHVGKVRILTSGTSGIAKTGNAEGTRGYVADMFATAYHPGDGDGLGITATGTRAGHGTVAVDPSHIPLGTNVYIPGYGHAVAADTGSAINGSRIDLCMETREECYAFGRQNVDVFVDY